MKKRQVGAARSPNGFNVLKNHETNWVFKRTLEEMSEKAAEIGECLYAASQINEPDVNSWINTWASLADRVLTQGLESKEKGQKISARECFLRACNYYRTAEYGCAPGHSRFHELWQKSVDAFHLACPLFDPPIQIVKVPFQGKMLPGYFWKPLNDVKKRPTMVAIGGNDSSGEEIFIVAGFGSIRRGYNFFTFEYPGHRGAVHLYPDCVKRPDYETPIKEALDLLETLTGVDERIILSGYSFGGFASARAACFEKRIRAVIPDSPIVDVPSLVLSGILGPLIKGIPSALLDKAITYRLRKTPLVRSMLDYSVWTWGAKSLSEEFNLDSFKQHIIRDEIKAITCPTLSLVSIDEGEEMVKQANFFHENISSKNKALHIFKWERDGSNDHCQLDNLSRGHQVAFDWLDSIFKENGPDF